MQQLLKNLYNTNYINILFQTINLNYSEFKQEDFKSSIFYSNWQNKELEQRISHISTTPRSYLPSNYENAIVVLKHTFNSIPTNKRSKSSDRNT